MWLYKLIDSQPIGDPLSMLGSIFIDFFGENISLQSTISIQLYLVAPFKFIFSYFMKFYYY